MLPFLTPSSEVVASKYRKMLEMGIPTVAIEFGMAINGVAANIVESVLAADEDIIYACVGNCSSKVSSEWFCSTICPNAF
jgi:hypothetical protein